MITPTHRVAIERDIISKTRIKAGASVTFDDAQQKNT
jgi:hypothetical protein